MTWLTRGELDVMYTGLSRGGLGEPRGQHLRRQTSDSAWTGSHRHRSPGSAGNDSRLRCWLHCRGWLCLDNVRPCVDRHRLAIVYNGGLDGDTCLTSCTGNNSRAHFIFPIQSCARSRGLHRRPGECYSGSCCLTQRLSWSDNILWVHKRRLNYAVWRWGHHRTGQPFWHHWSSVDSCDRQNSTAAAATNSTCHCRPPNRGSASWIVIVHSLAPIESLHGVWALFSRVIRESYTSVLP